MFLRLYPTEKLLYIPIDASYFSKLFRRSEKEDHTNEKKSSMGLSSKSLAGPGYIILNGIRVMNIIGFVAVVAANIGMLVKTSTNSHFFFFDAVSHVITVVISLFLIISELSLFQPYFSRYWPLLSPEHGFVALSICMLVLGTDILGNLNKESNSQDALGLAFWQITIASGIIIFILGWINLLASFIFCDRAQHITARQVRAHGAVAVHKTPIASSHTGSSYTPSAPGSYHSNPTSPQKGFVSNAFHILTSPRQEPVLPSYHAAANKTEPPSPSSKYSRATNCHKKGGVMSVFMGRKRQSVGPTLPVNVSAEREMEISGPLNINPQFAHLQRPDSALHPSRTGESETHRWRAS